HVLRRPGDHAAAFRVDAVLTERKSGDGYEPGVPVIRVLGDRGCLDEAVDAEAALKVGVDNLVPLQPGAASAFGRRPPFKPFL
ncbi:MAG: hypothetical protein M1134_02990, partial [Actinobacteria bacterium]|nr:hypothetical protein [Actinomycetota bacterium]